MRRTSIELAYDDGVIHAVWAPAERPSGPLIVAIHGAAYTWDYFDAVDDSLIALANANMDERACRARPGSVCARVSQLDRSRALLVE